MSVFPWMIKQSMARTANIRHIQSSINIYIFYLNILFKIYFKLCNHVAQLCNCSWSVNELQLKEIFKEAWQKCTYNTLSQGPREWLPNITKDNQEILITDKTVSNTNLLYAFYFSMPLSNLKVECFVYWTCRKLFRPYRLQVYQRVCDDWEHTCVAAGAIVVHLKAFTQHINSTGPLPQLNAF